MTPRSLASALRLPALLLFLRVGMAVGSDGLGWIYLNDYRLARLIGTAAPQRRVLRPGVLRGARVDAAAGRQMGPLAKLVNRRT